MKCSVGNCANPSRSRKLCRKHLRQEPDQKLKQQEYYKKNRDKFIERAMALDPDERKRRNKAQYKKHKEYVLKKQADYYKANKEKILAYLKEWRRKKKIKIYEKLSG